MGTLLEVKGLKKYFATPKGLLHAVDDINFTLEEGKTLGIVGESGAENPLWDVWSSTFSPPRQERSSFRGGIFQSRTGRR